MEVLRTLDAWGFDVNRIGRNGKLDSIEVYGSAAGSFVDFVLSVPKLTNVCALSRAWIQSKSLM